MSYVYTDVHTGDENSYKKMTTKETWDNSYPAEPAILRRQASLCLNLPVLAADGVTGVEQVVGIVFLLDGQELFIVGPPE